MSSKLANSVSLIGHLGIEPELKKFGNGKMCTRLSLATHDSYKSESGEWVNHTTWHNLVIWGKMAESALKNLHKGDQVAVSGKISTRNYTDKEGVKRFFTEIEVSDFMNLKEKEKAAAEPLLQ